jgi:hypothetical protein
MDFENRLVSPVHNSGFFIVPLKQFDNGEDRLGQSDGVEINIEVDPSSSCVGELPISYL